MKLQSWTKKLISEGRFTEKKLIEKLNYYGSKCWICGWRNASAIDHLIPQSYKEVKHLSNFKPICQPCNSAKNGQFPFDIEMLKARFRKPELSEIERLKLMAKIALKNCDIYRHKKENGKYIKVFATKAEIMISDIRTLAKAVLEFKG